ncbi:DNA helicase rad5 [Balamuthia mandrillaris]
MSDSSSSSGNVGSAQGRASSTFLSLLQSCLVSSEHGECGGLGGSPEASDLAEAETSEAAVTLPAKEGVPATGSTAIDEGLMASSLSFVNKSDGGNKEEDDEETEAEEEEENTQEMDTVDLHAWQLLSPSDAAAEKPSSSCSSSSSSPGKGEEGQQQQTMQLEEEEKKEGTEQEQQLRHDSCASSLKRKRGSGAVDVDELKEDAKDESERQQSKGTDSSKPKQQPQQAQTRRRRVLPFAATPPKERNDEVQDEMQQEKEKEKETDEANTNESDANNSSSASPTKTKKRRVLPTGWRTAEQEERDRVKAILRRWPRYLGRLLCTVRLRKQSTPRTYVVLDQEAAEKEKERTFEEGTPVVLKAAMFSSSSTYVGVHTMPPEDLNIGAIPKEQSQYLSPLLKEDKIEVRATIFRTASVNDEEVLTLLKIYVKNNTLENTDAELQRQMQEAKARREGLRKKQAETNRTTSKQRANKKNEPKKKRDVTVEDQPLGMLIQAIQSQLQQATMSVAESLALKRQKTMPTLDWFEKASELVDKLYQNETAHEELKEMDPSASLGVTLRPYQKKSLWWMIQRENGPVSSGENSDASDGSSSSMDTGSTTSENGSGREAKIDEKNEDMFCDANPLYVKFQFYNEEDDSADDSFYYNKFTGNISLRRPPSLSRTRGGILADDMGLGKTVQGISLILTNVAPPSSGPPTPLPRAQPVPSNGTLIICPLSVMHQWCSELEKKTAPSTKLSISTYYGHHRTVNTKLLASYDVVLTTYSTLATEFVKTQQGHKQYRKGATCPLLKIKWFRVILDEAHLIRDRKTNMAKACCALISQRKWCFTATPIQNKLDDLFSLFHFLELDPFGDIEWWNEMIKKPYEAQDKNSIILLQSILKPLFLRRTKTQLIDGAKVVDLPTRTVNTVELDFSEPEREFYVALYRQSRVKFRMLKQSQAVMHNYASVLAMLLRLRQCCDHPILVLRAIIEEKDRKYRDLNWWTEMKAYVREVDAELKGKTDDEEDDIVSTPISIANSKDKAIQEEREEEGEEAEIKPEEEEERMLQADKEKDTEAEFAPLLDQSQECRLCLELLDAPVITPCGHIFCQECITKVFLSQNNNEDDEDEKAKEKKNEQEEAPCPTCKKYIREDQLEPWKKAEEDEAFSSSSAEEGKENGEMSASSFWEQSTKIQHLLRTLKKIAKEEPDVKSVVFSQWTSMLDIVGRALHQNGFRFVRLDGAMTSEHRERAIHDFYHLSDVKVFLISLKAGGLGLNLICASRVFLMDPWWNPATEEQAIDRVHRIGQTRPVEVHRFIMKNSVEQKILKLQERKWSLASCTLAVSGEQQKKMVMENRLDALFSMSLGGGHECSVCFVEYKTRIIKCVCGSLVCKNCKTECTECNRIMCEHCYVLCYICSSVLCEDCFYKNEKQERDQICRNCLKEEAEKQLLLQSALREDVLAAKNAKATANSRRRESSRTTRQRANNK